MEGIACESSHRIWPLRNIQVDIAYSQLLIRADAGVCVHELVLFLQPKTN